MTISVDLQIATLSKNIPAPGEIERWVCTALSDIRDNAEMTVRIVDEVEATELNKRWRQANGPTNVLSFPVDGNEAFVPELLGDIVICAPVIEKEAESQKKSIQAHWAHMVVHGTLHLLGFDHGNDTDAEKMETLEIQILDKLGITNPYI